MIGELELELRRLLKGLDGQTAIFLGCFGVLLAQMAWLAFRGALPAPSILPLFTGLAATLAAHSYFLSQRGLVLWLNAIDRRLGEGSGVALLRSAMLPQAGRDPEAGLKPGAGHWSGDEAAASPLKRAHRLACFAPLALAASAFVFTRGGLQGAGLACGFGALLSGTEAVNLGSMIKAA